MRRGRVQVTGRKALWVAPANLVAIEGKDPAASQDFVEGCLATGLADADAVYWSPPPPLASASARWFRLVVR